MKQVEESYSSKWRIFEDVAFSERDMEFQYNWYISRFGFKNEEGLKKFLESKSCILDAGCGVGKAIGWFSNFSRGKVFGVDISADTISIAYKHYGMRPNVHFIQADIRNLPFKREIFDYISCDQVIHHTPDPEATFDHLVKFLRIGGQIVA